MSMSGVDRRRRGLAIGGGDAIAPKRWSPPKRDIGSRAPFSSSMPRCFDTATTTGEARSCRPRPPIVVGNTLEGAARVEFAAHGVPCIPMGVPVTYTYLDMAITRSPAAAISAWAQACERSRHQFAVRSSLDSPADRSDARLRRVVRCQSAVLPIPTDVRAGWRPHPTLNCPWWDRPASWPPSGVWRLAPRRVESSARPRRGLRYDEALLALLVVTAGGRARARTCRRIPGQGRYLLNSRGSRLAAGAF